MWTIVRASSDLDDLIGVETAGGDVSGSHGFWPLSTSSLGLVGSELEGWGT